MSNWCAMKKVNRRWVRYTAYLDRNVRRLYSLAEIQCFSVLLSKQTVKCQRINQAWCHSVPMPKGYNIRFKAKIKTPLQKSLVCLHYVCITQFSLVWIKYFFRASKKLLHTYIIQCQLRWMALCNRYLLNFYLFAERLPITILCGEPCIIIKLLLGQLITNMKLLSVSKILFLQ